MARLLLAAMPFTGHLEAVCALAGEPSTRGHDVRIYTGSSFAARVAASGARHVAWEEAPDFDEHHRRQVPRGS